jgi:hypothetical protein
MRSTCTANYLIVESVYARIFFPCKFIKPSIKKILRDIRKKGKLLSRYRILPITSLITKTHVSWQRVISLSWPMIRMSPGTGSFGNILCRGYYFSFLKYSLCICITYFVSGTTMCSIESVP